MQKACNSLSCTLLLIVYYVFTFWHYFTSSKTTLTDYQCVSTGCCTHVAKTEITIDNPLIINMLQNHCKGTDLSPSNQKKTHKISHSCYIFLIWIGNGILK